MPSVFGFRAEGPGGIVVSLGDFWGKLVRGHSCLFRACGSGVWRWIGDMYTSGVFIVICIRAGEIFSF